MQCNIVKQHALIIFMLCFPKLRSFLFVSFRRLVLLFNAARKNLTPLLTGLPCLHLRGHDWSQNYLLWLQP